MNQLAFPILTLVTFLPLGGALAVALVPRRSAELIKGTALAFSALDFILSLALLAFFDPTTAAMQFVERAPWIGQLGISYQLGIDGISLWLVLLTTFLTPLAIWSSWVAVTDRLKEYMIIMLLLETGMIGVFVATDLVLFYVFWEAMLIPMYLLIGVWGGPRRVYAAIKFVLFTMAGSVLMLVGILVLAVIHQQMVGSLSFDLFDLLRTPVPADLEPWLFAAFALAFAIKVPIFPLHTWLPDAHVEAPTAGSVLLAGILLKMGVYGYLRFAIPLFPQAARDFAPLFAVLGIVGIIYGALVAMVQPDVKKLVAYSSVSHLGFVVLGTFVFNAQGVSGGILQMVNHGLSTGALFLLVGMIYERRHTRMIADFGGLAKTMPVYATFFLIVMLSSIGLPGLNGFVGEFTILLGTFRANMTYAVLATTGVILAAWYMLGMYQRVFHGWPTGVQTAEAATGHHNHHHGGDHQTSEASEDLTWREIGILVPIVIVIVLIGVYPGPFFQVMGPSVEALIGLVR